MAFIGQIVIMCLYFRRLELTDRRMAWANLVVIGISCLFSCSGYTIPVSILFLLWIGLVIGFLFFTLFCQFIHLDNLNRDSVSGITMRLLIFPLALPVIVIGLVLWVTHIFNLTTWFIDLLNDPFVNMPDKIGVLSAEKRETFELKSETSTLAADATLNLTVEDIEPGEYLYTLTSDFAPANYSFKAYVYDVLMPEISIDKSVYTVGESREAIVKVEMDYGYPYVGAATSSDKPTVTVNAELLNEVTSVSYSDEAWADSDMHCIAEIKIPLEKVTEETVTENKGEIPLNLSILFNDAIKYETTISLPFVGGSSGIHDIDADNSGKSHARYFNIFGVEVDESYRGLVITSDGKKIVR